MICRIRSNPHFILRLCIQVCFRYSKTFVSVFGAGPDALVATTQSLAFFVVAFVLPICLYSIEKENCKREINKCRHPFFSFLFASHCPMASTKSCKPLSRFRDKFILLPEQFNFLVHIPNISLVYFTPSNNLSWCNLLSHAIFVFYSSMYNLNLKLKFLDDPVRSSATRVPFLHRHGARNSWASQPSQAT